MSRETIILHLGWNAFLDILSDEELGQWTRAVFQYMETGEVPDGLSKIVQIAFFAASERINRDSAKYEEISEARRKAGSRGGEASAKAKAAKQSQADESKGQQSQANESKGQQSQANESKGQAKASLPNPNPNPDPNPVLSSSSDDNRAAAAAAETKTTTAQDGDILDCLANVRGCASEAARRELAGWVDKLGHDAVLDIARDCVAAGAESWSYVRKALSNRASGVSSRPPGRNVRVDRQAPSGNDFIRAAMDRPRCLKRRE